MLFRSNDTATTEIYTLLYTLSLLDALPIFSDDVREEAWVERLVMNASGTTIVICGYLHFESLAKKLRARGHTVDQRVYLETVPEIRQA